MRNIVISLFIIAAVFQAADFVSANMNYTAENDKQVASEERGRISGEVRNSGTGEPIVGAYVGVGDFGDSGGSNYSRHSKQGLFAKAQTDEQGRFVLDGIAFREHPLVVTHSEFIRHDQKVTLQKGFPEPHVKIALRPAARINVTVVDSSGRPLEGFWLFCLEALDGRRFIPPGRDPHLSSFASSIWMERVMKINPAQRSISGATGYSFTALDSGEYSVDAIKLSITDNPTSAPEGMNRLPIDTSRITYYGSVPNLAIEAGETKEVQIEPVDYQSSVTIVMPEDTVKKPEIPPFISISRDVGLLVWYDGKVHHPEDHRLGRLQKKSLYYSPVVDGDFFEIKNLPPGGYSVYAGPIYFMSAVKIEVSSGREIVVNVPPTEPKETSKVSLLGFDNKVKLEDREYSLSELCQIISARTDSKPRVVTDASIEDEKLKPGDQEMTIWSLMEAIYLAGGWKLSEQEDEGLMLNPAQ
ncbi:MAG: hypothetical protein JW715_15875 [Sedimentisphaerales bacterium]|nr:hypothetical protein [Sedimentisphaerales bacterium]